MMLLIPEIYRKPTPPDFMPDMEAVKKMGKYNEELQKSWRVAGARDSEGFGSSLKRRRLILVD
jgi:hypothetical protein